ncbi:MAG: hypothetical protein EBR59_06850, partial [Methylococcaceae bacterium]|nr:hypothetical protein [Methylococcaceae bacterium]
GDTSSDLDYKATSSLTLNGGTIKDAAGNNATLTLASPGAANSLANAKALVVDGVLPAFLNASGSTSPSNGGTLQKSSGVFPLIVLDFSESVQLITGKTLANNISIVSPLGAGNKSIDSGQTPKIIKLKPPLRVISVLTASKHFWVERRRVMA